MDNDTGTSGMVDSADTADQSLVVIGIGASAGGLKALTSFFAGVPEESGMAFVVVMHLSPEHESHLAELLQNVTAIPVTQVTGQVTIEPNHVYVIPPVKRLDARNNILILSEFTEPRGQRAPIDHFFETMASVYRDGAAIILSGGGMDGSRGIAAVKEAGGLILAQDPEESEHPYMPKAAIATGLVDLVLPASEMGSRLVEMKRMRGALRSSGESSNGDEPDADALNGILALLQTRTGHDFSFYKRPTVLRRIHRRVVVTGQSDLRTYSEYLAAHEDEADALMKDLLIGVTNFFRDEEAFEALTVDVIPRLFEGKGPDDSVRVWVAGCSTGEEAYSLAILLHEAREQLDDPPRCQVLASDLDRKSLDTARAGLYPETIRAVVGEERLKRYFTLKDEHFTIVRSIRDTILFAEHSILKDPPFSRIDLISCRNVLIYLQREMQERVFRMFHYALADDGYLFLGNAESVDASASLFSEVSRSNRIFRKKSGANAATPFPLMDAGGQDSAPVRERAGRHGALADASERQHIQALEVSAPPSVLVDEHFSVVHLSESAGRYLQPQRGPLINDLTGLVRAEFKSELFTALFQAFRNGTPTVARPIRVEFDEAARMVYLTVRSVPADQGHGKLALVLFNESDRPVLDLAEDSMPESASDAARRHDELLQLRQSLKSVAAEYEIAREQMKARNEELLSINEEYKSTVEELETSKEELQSLNEELETVNSELKLKVDEVTEAHADLGNLIDSTDIATVYLDRNLMVRSVTPRVSGRFGIRPADTGNPVSQLHHPFLDRELESRARSVLDDMTPLERKVQDPDGTWYLERIRPYETLDGHVGGVIVTFVDINGLQTAEKALQKLNDELESRIEERTRQVRDLAMRLTMAEQRERRRISQALHDDLQQVLYGIRMKLDFVRNGLIAGDTSGLTEQVTEAHTWILGALEMTRKLVVELSPPILTSKNMEDALHWLALQMEEMHALNVEVEVGAHEKHRQPAEDVRVLLFRIVRELLFNVVKHARTDHALVRVERRDDTLQIRVIDEGCGFDAADVLVRDGAGESFGLFSIRERLSLVGGRFEIESEPGVGTTALLSVSINGETFD